jgi:hypothetical protein
MDWRKGFLLIAFSVVTALSAQKIALNFDGTDDFVETKYAGVSGTGARTIEAWIRTTANCDPNNGGKQKVICDYGAMSTGNRFTLNLLFGNKLRIEVGGSGLMGQTVLNDGNWHHVGVSYDPSNSSAPFRLYVDGKLDTTGSIPTTVNTSSSMPLRIGMRIDNTNMFEGDIDEVRCYEQVLSDSLIKAHYNEEFCKVPSRVKAYYKLSEGTSSGNNSSKKTATDYSGNSNHGTLYNFALSGSSSNWISGANLKGGNTASSLTTFACSTYTAPSGKTYSFSGTYNDIISNAFGCDSVITIKLTIGKVNKAYAVSGCDSFVSPAGIVYYADGSYFEKYQTWRGCDSNIRYQVTIFKSFDTSISVQACDSFVSPGWVSYTQSGQYTESYKTVNGCDSIIHYNIQINHPVSTYDTLVACDTAWIMGKPQTSSQSFKFVSQTWQGCDSFHYLELIVHYSQRQMETASGCQSYTSPSGQTYTSTGVYSEVFSTWQGCDSIIDYHVTIFQPIVQYDTLNACRVASLRGQSYVSDQMVTWVGKSFGGCDSTVHTLIWITKPDDAISASNDTLFAAPGADTYRWMKCSNQTLIAGATSAWYSPALDGDYAVVVSLGNCKDTSQCITIMHMGLEAWAKNSVQVVPNPSSGEAYLVSTPGQPVPEKWRVYDRSGRLIQEGHVNSKSNRLPLLPTGIYLLECEMPSGQRQSITWICQ